MIKYNMDALEYISKLSEGGMRDAISLMDKCLAYSKDLTLGNVVAALGTIDYDVMCDFTDDILTGADKSCLTRINALYADGKDLKQFIKQYTQFLLDVLKQGLGCDWSLIGIPRLPEYEKWMKELDESEYEELEALLKMFVQLNSSIKYSSTPKYDLEAALFLYLKGGAI